MLRCRKLSGCSCFDSGPNVESCLTSWVSVNQLKNNQAGPDRTGPDQTGLIPDFDVTYVYKASESNQF